MANERDPLLNSEAVRRQQRQTSKRRFAVFITLALVFVGCILAISLPLALTSRGQDDVSNEKDSNPDVTVTSGYTFFMKQVISVPLAIGQFPPGRARNIRPLFPEDAS